MSFLFRTFLVRIILVVPIQQPDKNSHLDLLDDRDVVAHQPLPQEMPLLRRHARVERRQLPERHDLVAERRARVL